MALGYNLHVLTMWTEMEQEEKDDPDGYAHLWLHISAVENEVDLLARKAVTWSLEEEAEDVSKKATDWDAYWDENRKEEVSLRDEVEACMEERDEHAKMATAYKAQTEEIEKRATARDDNFRSRISELEGLVLEGDSASKKLSDDLEQLRREDVLRKEAEAQ